MRLAYDKLYANTIATGARNNYSVKRSGFDECLLPCLRWSTSFLEF
jgi:hypothetical protein